VASDRLSEGCEALGKDYPFGVLTVWLPGGPNPLWRTPPLLGVVGRAHFIGARPPVGTRKVPAASKCDASFQSGLRLLFLGFNSQFDSPLI
jgi:hypothetical protein